MTKDGHCQTCNVLGCEQCSSDNPEVCLECVDSSAATLSSDSTECVCNEEYHKPNPFGHCQYCFVDGCASCSFTAYECRQCTDPNAVL